MITIGCYQPLLRIEDQLKWVKAEDGHLYHPARILSGKTDLENYDWIQDKQYKHQWIPCGQCIGCRMDYSREWADRGYLESKLWGENRTWFVTLTINDDYIIKNDYVTDYKGFTWTKEEGVEYQDDEWQGELIPRSMQLFMKRFRKEMKKINGADNIRFMCCGEYGLEGGRPHYHIILFNCPLPAESFYESRLNKKQGVYYYRNKIIEKIWSDPKTKESYGISNIADATWNAMAYVGRYITKKIKGPTSDQENGLKGRTKEFFRVSNQPGIARQYYELHKDEIYERDEILIINRQGTQWVKPPKYFDDLYEKDNPEHFEKIKENRERMMFNKLIEKGQHTSLTRYEQMQIEMRTKTGAAGSLVRNL